MNNIDLLMQINDGHNPYAHQNIIFGNGGLGYKPYGNMIGGMAMRDANGNLKTQYFKKEPTGELNKKKMTNINVEELPDLINMDPEVAPEEKEKYYMTEISDMVRIYNQDKRNENLEILTPQEKQIRKEQLIRGINALSADITNPEKIEIIEALKEIIEKKPKNERRKLEPSETLNKINENITKQSSDLFNQMNEKASKEKDSYKLLNDEIKTLKGLKRNALNDSDTEKLEELEILLREKIEERNKIDRENPNIKESKDINTLRGMDSEDYLTSHSQIFKSVDNDNSKFKNTKNMNAYAPNFNKTINDHLEGNTKEAQELYRKKLLSYIPFDGVKKNSIWELKSFGTNNKKFNNYSNEYNQTKLKNSNFDLNIGNNNDHINFTWKYKVERPTIIAGQKIYSTYETYRPELNGKIIGIENIKLEITPRNGGNTITIDNILPIRKKGYKYYFMESTPKNMRFINPLEQMKEHNFIQKDGKDIVEIRQEKFRNLAPTYERQNKNKTVKSFLYERKK